MIYLDDSNLIQRATESDQAFHVGVRSDNIKDIFIDGNPVLGVVYVDLEKGFLIRFKTDLESKPIVIAEGLVHEILFGNVTVEYR